MLLYLLSRLTLALAALASLALWRHRPTEGRPVASLLLALLALDVARLGTAGALDVPLWVADVALTAGWYVALTAGVMALLSGTRPPWRRLLAWTSALAGVLLLSGWRGAALTSAWRGVWLASAALQAGATLLWIAGAVRARRWPGPAEGVALLLCASTVADGAGAWAAVDPGAAWELARWQAVVTWGAVAGWVGWASRSIPADKMTKGPSQRQRAERGRTPPEEGRQNDE